MNNPMMTLMNLMKQGQNPQQIMMQMQQMANGNPQMQQALNQMNIANAQMQQSGMSMKQYAMQYARQNNIDIQQVISMFNQFGIKL